MRNCLLIFLLLLGHFAQAEVKVNLDIEYFALIANSPDELLKKIKALHTGDQSGKWSHINWHMINEVNFNSTAKGCKLRHLDGEVDMVMTLPRWSNIDELPQMDQDWWLDLKSNMLRHKHNHKNHLIEVLNASAKEYEAIGEQASCTLVRNAYRNIKKKYAEQLRVKDRALDIKEGAKVCLESLMTRR